MSTFLDAVLLRRSRYALSAETTLADEALADMLRQLVKNLPTAYNMQNTRLVLLTGEAHKTLWNHIVLEALRAVAKPERFPATQQKIAGFAAGYGSLLFFLDDAVTEEYKRENPAFAANFDDWCLQHSGMLQFSAWTLLAEQGLGASLQHYNPLIDDAVKATWKLPQSWRLLAQMPFGKPTAPAGEKTFVNTDKRFLTFNTAD